MQVQVNSSNQIAGSVALQEWVGSTVVAEVERFEELLTRIEVHLSDENAQKAGPADKRCQIEFHPKGHQAMSVTHKAESFDLAVAGAATKMRHALERLDGRLDNTRKTPAGELFDPLAEQAPPAETDALLEQDFLDRQRELGRE